MRGIAALVLLLFSMPADNAPIRRRQDTESSDLLPLTTIAPPPLLPTVPANRHGIMIWMCQNNDVLHIVDEVKQDIDVTDVKNLTAEVYSRLIDFRPTRLWSVYSTVFTTRSTANLIMGEDEPSTSPSLCFVQFNENPQILVVADLAEVI